MHRERGAGDDPVPLTDALDDVLRSLRGGAGRAEVRGVFGQWDEAVGEAIAAHVRPVRLDRGVLLVDVDDPSWATQVRLLADELRSRLSEVAGVSVERIEVRVAAPRPSRFVSAGTGRNGPIAADRTGWRAVVPPGENTPLVD